MTTIALIDQNTASHVFEFVCREFVRGSELHRATGVGVDEYIDYFKTAYFSMIAENLSFVAVDHRNNEISGCLLAGRFQPCDAVNAASPQSIQPIKAIIAQLEGDCVPRLTLPLTQTILVDIAMVAPAASGQGLYTALRRALHSRAVELGYTSVIGELSSKATQKVCVEKLGHRLVGQVDYKTFQFNGAYPFASIDNTDSIQMVEHLLA